MEHAEWSALSVADWDDTRETLHRWTQVVGKVRLALEPMINHWWQVPLYVSARGLTTGLMPDDKRGVEIEFDFVDHILTIGTSDGERRELALEPRSVADFYRAVMSTLGDLGVDVAIMPRPVEIPDATPFPEDETHRSYDSDAVHRFWQQLLQAHRVMLQFRSEFIGKASPVHFFWGAADLATSRFSGRPAPMHRGGVPNCPDWVQQLAYSHEVSSCGFWPGGSEEGSFYAYIYPEPDGYRDAPISEAGAYYDDTLGEFILPYAAVRTAPDPDEVLLGFFRSTYEAAADLAKWDRAALEAPTIRSARNPENRHG
jgi:hypothetical protein